jgi:hypothetical protein
MGNGSLTCGPSPAKIVTGNIIAKVRTINRQRIFHSLLVSFQSTGGLWFGKEVAMGPASIYTIWQMSHIRLSLRIFYVNNANWMQQIFRKAQK